MRVLLILFFVFFSTLSYADERIIDSTNWTQEQKNMTKAMVVMILYENGIKYDNVSVNLPKIEIINPSSDITSILVQETIETKYSTWRANQDIAEAQAAVIAKEKKDEVINSELNNITLSDVNNKIDAINNLAELKIFLKKLVRYLVAKTL